MKKVTKKSKSKSKVKDEDLKKAGFSLFIDEDRNRIMKWIFGLAYKKLEKDAIHIASLTLADEATAKITVMKAGELIESIDPSVKNEFDNFLKEIAEHKGKIKEVNKLIEYLMEREKEMGWSK